MTRWQELQVQLSAFLETDLNEMESESLVSLHELLQQFDAEVQAIRAERRRLGNEGDGKTVAEVAMEMARKGMLLTGRTLAVRAGGSPNGAAVCLNTLLRHGELVKLGRKEGYALPDKR